MSLGWPSLGLGKTVIPFHLGPWTPTEVALAYKSTSALGVQITALQGLYNDIGNLTTATSDVGQGISIENAQSKLATILIALVALDQQTIAWQKQVADYVTACQAATGSKSSPGTLDKTVPFSGCPPGVDPMVTGLIATAAAAAGGIVGFMTGRAVKKK